MLTDSPLLLLVCVWLGLGVILVLIQLRSGAGVGLVGAYTLQLFMLHWLCAAIYVLPWYWYLNVDTLYQGLLTSTIAFAGFTLGAVAVAFFRTAKVAVPEHLGAVDRKTVRVYAAIGVGSYLVLRPMFGHLPTISALLSTASSCAVLALALACWNATHSERPGRLWVWIAITCLLPFVTIASEGFLGYGLAASAVVMMFIGSFYRPVWRSIVVGILGGYIGLSLYVTYMRDRNDIRTIVWAGQSAASRGGRLLATFADIELFDIYNIKHLQRVDLRLNQNYLVGSAVQNMAPRPELFADGATLADAVLAMVPRVLWPNKPMVAGSGDLVNRFTGIRFAEGTSVGIGQVLELYANFGNIGVFLGFIVIGGVLIYVDGRAAAYRNRQDWHGFILWYLPGLGLLQLGGSLIDVTTSVAAGVAVAMIVNRINKDRRLSLRQPAPGGMASHSIVRPLR